MRRITDYPLFRNIQYVMTLPFWWIALRAKININVDISQQVLIPKIISRLEMDGPLSQEKKDEINEGLCFGFSVRFGIYASHNKLDYWFDKLQKTAQWDGDKKSLRLNDELLRVTGLVSYGATGDQAEPIVSDIPNISQELFFKSSHFLPQYKLKAHAAFAGCMNQGQLATVLSLPLFQVKESVCLIGTQKHACAIAKYGTDWLYYDPDYSCGPIYSKTIPELCDRIFAAFHDYKYPEFDDWLFLKISSQRALEVRLSTWNSTIIHSSSAPQADLLNMDLLFEPTMLSLSGFSLIVLNAPEQFEKLCVLAQTDKKIRTAMAAAMSVQDFDGETGLHYIACYAPAWLPIMLKLAKMDEDFRTAIIAVLSMKNKKNEKAIDFIQRHAPQKIYQKFVALQNQRDAISTPYFFKKRFFAEGKAPKSLPSSNSINHG